MPTQSALAQALQQVSQCPVDQLNALGLTTMLDGMWTDYFLYPQDFNREKALGSVFMFLDAMYAGQFGTTAAC